MTDDSAVSAPSNAAQMASASYRLPALDQGYQHSVLSTIVHAGHLSNLEHPTEFNDQLQAFLHRCTEKSFSFQKPVWMDR